MNEKSSRNATRSTVIVVLFVAVLLAAALGVLRARRASQPIQIGFVGSLTGSYAHWGVAVRDGLLFFVERTNAAGGVMGRRLELIVRDDAMEPDRCAAIVEEFARQGVVAIAGPTLSSSALKAVPVANRVGMLLISPSVSTGDLSLLDDNFIRVCTAEDEPARIFADHLYHGRGWRRIAAVVSAANQDYHENLLKLFKKHFESLGGRIESVDLLTPSSNLEELGDLMAKKRADGIYILAPPTETATLCQRIRSHGSSVPFAFIGSPTDMEFAQFGGVSMEGATTIFNSLTLNPDPTSWNAFTRQYRERYGVEPHQGSALGNDAGVVIVRALEQGKDYSAGSLKAAILRIGRFHGAKSPFRIDQFGDTFRGEWNVVVLHQGRFEILSTK